MGAGPPGVPDGEELIKQLQPSLEQLLTKPVADQWFSYLRLIMVLVNVLAPVLLALSKRLITATALPAYSDVAAARAKGLTHVKRHGTISGKMISTGYFILHLVMAIQVQETSVYPLILVAASLVFHSVYLHTDEYDTNFLFAAETMSAAAIVLQLAISLDLYFAWLGRILLFLGFSVVFGRTFEII